MLIYLERISINYWQNDIKNGIMYIEIRKGKVNNHCYKTGVCNNERSWKVNTNPTGSKHKKRTIKWENVLLIPLVIFAISGIIKSNTNLIVPAIVIHLIIVFSYYYIIKTIRITIKEKGLKKTIIDFINLN